MTLKTFAFEYEWVSDQSKLKEKDRTLVLEAQKATANAYAPYSKYHVAAVARLQNGIIVSATNQENASYPVGICAERTLLSILGNMYPDILVDTICINYYNHSSKNPGNTPASPCGLCRQSLLEYEQRIGHPIRLILASPSGPVVIIKSVTDLLPFGFGPNDLKG